MNQTKNQPSQAKTSEAIHGKQRTRKRKRTAFCGYFSMLYPEVDAASNLPDVPQLYQYTIAHPSCFQTYPHPHLTLHGRSSVGPARRTGGLSGQLTDLFQTPTPPHVSLSEVRAGVCPISCPISFVPHPTPAQVSDGMTQIVPTQSICAGCLMPQRMSENQANPTQTTTCEPFTQASPTTAVHTVTRRALNYVATQTSLAR
jgi:hypothetical protein